MKVRKLVDGPRWPLPFRVVHARAKLFVALAVGLIAAVLLPSEWRLTTRALAGWDIAVTLYLMIVYWTVGRCDVAHIRQRAIVEDEGRFAILVLTVTAALASLGAIVALLGSGQAGGKSDHQQLALAIGTIFLSWGFIHTIFALHYAHDYYSKTPAGAGLDFPGGQKPGYWDFVYFSFVVGMTFQVSDVAITAPDLRKTVTAHSLVSFVFNVALLALTVNIAASAL